MKQLTPIQLAKELFKIHHHVKFEGSDKEEIVYKEAELIELLNYLGYPSPDFDGYGKKCEKELISCPGDTIKETLDEKEYGMAESNPGKYHL